MANLGILNKTSDKKGKTVKSVSVNALKIGMESIGKELTSLKALMIGVIVVLLIGFIAAIGSYFMMVQNAFTDYKNTVNQFNDERIKNLQDRVLQLEYEKRATQSVTPKGQ